MCINEPGLKSVHVETNTKEEKNLLAGKCKRGQIPINTMYLSRQCNNTVLLIIQNTMHDTMAIIPSFVTMRVL